LPTRVEPKEEEKAKSKKHHGRDREVETTALATRGRSCTQNTKINIKKFEQDEEDGPEQKEDRSRTKHGVVASTFFWNARTLKGGGNERVAFLGTFVSRPDFFVNDECVFQAPLPPL